MIRETVIRECFCDCCGKKCETLERNDFQVDLKDNSYCILGVHNYWEPYDTNKNKNPDFCSDCLILVLEEAIKQIKKRREEQ